MEHWIERIADDLKDRDVEKHVIASGTSISGAIHIGNSCDVFIANAIGKQLKKIGEKSETIWIADNHDPLRKVPHPLPESYDKYLGMPYSNIPCPDGCCSSFVEHFETPLLDVLDKFKIKLTTKSGFEMYKNGSYDEYIRIALKNADKIRKIFNKYRKKPLDKDWLPYNPICDECRRVNTTTSYAYEENTDKISYKCECGHDSIMNITSGNGKLTWRLEWAVRWKIFGVTCEPFGKDHAASGGSYDISKKISEEIFNYKAPYPVPYEWITLNGKSMSKSQGVFFTPKQWLEIGPAESLNYFIFRSKPMKHKDFSPNIAFLDLMDQFDKVEKTFFNEEKAPSEKEEKKFKKIYEITQIHNKEPLPFRPPYRFLTVAYQITGNNPEKIFEILKKNSQLTKSFKNKEFKNLTKKELDEFNQRIENVKNWLNKYAPKYAKFQIMKKIPKLELSNDQKAFLKDLANIIEKKEFNSAEELHDKMYETLKYHNLKPQKAFQIIYKTLIGQKQGPKAASFILSLDKKFVIKRLKLEE